MQGNHDCSGGCERREFLFKTLAAGSLLLIPGVGHAASIRQMAGGVRVNGKPADSKTAIRAGDRIVTGPDASLAFVLGDNAFLLRHDSELHLEGPSGNAVITGFRMLTGAIVSVFGKGPKTLHTATATAGIRGTGVYIEARPDVTYLCTCYGEVELQDNQKTERHTVLSANHVPNFIYAHAKNGKMMEAAPFQNHSNEELAMLEALVGRKPRLPTTN